MLNLTNGPLTILCLIGLSSCAGPMTPFGSADFTAKKQSTPSRMPSSFITSTKADIDFRPTRQNWHDSIVFETKFIDANGFGPDSSIRFFYNGTEVTKAIEGHSRIYRSKDEKTITYSIPHFRLDPEMRNQISVSYQRDDHSSPLVKYYREPRCPMNSIQKVTNHGKFKSKASLFNTIEKLSLKEGLNPSLIAGLIAQESGFNPAAISWAKAIGLTQVTSLAEEHIVKKYPMWPRYDGISTYSYPITKSLILTGKINNENEWRLNPERSILGGIEYLRYVKKYWSISKNRLLVKNNFLNPDKALEKIILASYNSGPSRVKRAVIKRGRDWLNASNLGEAKKYVGRVQSYCFHFSDDNEFYAYRGGSKWKKNLNF